MFFTKSMHSLIPLTQRYILMQGLQISKSTLKIQSRDAPANFILSILEFLTRFFLTLDSTFFTIMLFKKKVCNKISPSWCARSMFSLSHYFRPLADFKDDIKMGIESLLKKESISNISDSKQLIIMEERDKSILKQVQNLIWHNGAQPI